MCPTIKRHTISIPVCRSLIGYFNSVLTGNWKKKKKRHLFWHLLKRIFSKIANMLKQKLLRFLNAVGALFSLYDLDPVSACTSNFQVVNMKHTSSFIQFRENAYVVRTGRHKCMCLAELGSIFPLLHVRIDCQVLAKKVSYLQW